MIIKVYKISISQYIYIHYLSKQISIKFVNFPRMRHIFQLFPRVLIENYRMYID